jgi:hypothetical protein
VCTLSVIYISILMIIHILCDGWLQICFGRFASKVPRFCQGNNTRVTSISV